jgi:hypothetical protein
VKVYVNGTQVTAFDTATYSAQNTDGFINSTAYNSGVHNIGRFPTTDTAYLDGYLTEINFVDGQALTASSFGETNPVTGVWQPKQYTGTYGTNGFFLKFSDNSNNTAATIGKDYSGNGNNWTPNNISVTSGATYDSMLDVPTLWADGGNGRGNYAVLNPLKMFGANFAITQGNLQASDSTSATVTAIASMYLPTTGKWYFEVTATTVGAASACFIGIAPESQANGNGTFGNYGSYRSNGAIYNLASTGQTSGATYTSGDVIGVAVDLDAGTCQFYKNNVAQGSTPSFTFTAGSVVVPFVATDNVAGTKTFHPNFGQRPFAYTPPSGFKALQTGNLPEPVIKKGNQWFDATVWTGNGTSQNIVNAAGFAPDMVWGKSRTNAYANVIVDTIRGSSNYLNTASTSGESTNAQVFSSLNSNGFGVGNDLTLNANAASHVAWQWKEGATPGFDIVTYTGTGSAQNISHLLGVTPAMMIVKARSLAGENWQVYHKNMAASPQTNQLLLNSTAAVQSATVWNNTAPTSSVFSVSGGGPVGSNGQTYVAYLFAEVAGFSRFGSYTGNGSTDGPFVYLGFRPRFVMTKRTDSSTSGNWMITDSARNTYNLAGEILIPNLSDGEYSQDGIDMLSNGFKMRASTGNRNTNGGTFIYAAFAEFPFRTALAR